jgi:hypothetical protein
MAVEAGIMEAQLGTTEAEVGTEVEAGTTKVEAGTEVEAR